MKSLFFKFKMLPSLFLFFSLPMLANASVEGSLQAVQTKITGTILPLAAVIGLLIAGCSFVLGHENARQKLILAIAGCIVGFGAESIVNFFRSLIH